MTVEDFEEDYDAIMMGINDDDEDVGCDAWWRGWGVFWILGVCWWWSNEGREEVWDEGFMRG